MQATQLWQKVKGYGGEDNLPHLERAYSLAQRLNPEGVEHSLEVAYILAEMGMDVASLQASLFVDTPGELLGEVEDSLGAEIVRLIEEVAKLNIAFKSGEKGAARVEGVRKMLISIADEPRVVLIWLAARLALMRHLKAVPPERRREIAQETLDVYAPLSHRLGIWELKWQLEDISFLYLEPVRYRYIQGLLRKGRKEREVFLSRTISVLKSKLAQGDFKSEVTGRTKNIYSISQKMERYAGEGKGFGHIRDILALRILVGNVADCYHALGIVHSLWHPILSEFNDYIASPKENGYQSLHTTVMCFGTTPLEIQIRTFDMHRTAEYGIAAHYKYKGEGGGLEEKVSFLRQALKLQKEFPEIDLPKVDELLAEQILVYTPKGDIVELPPGSTPLDFAYRIHTDLGHRCTGAKVNGKLSPLNSHLKSGDTVDIIPGKEAKPSLDWLNPDLGYVNTSHAREKVRQWFRKREKMEAQSKGREILEGELKKLGIVESADEIAHLLNYERADALYAALGCGEITTAQIALKLEQKEAPPEKEVKLAPRSAGEIWGRGELLKRLAGCCHPIPGDEIVGYVTRGRGITIHRLDCPNIVHEEEVERLIPLSWGEVQRVYPVDIQIEAWDRVGLFRDITTLISSEGINISHVSTSQYDDSTVIILLTLEIEGVSHLAHILSRIENIPEVKSVLRINK
jgi:GTP pyrophosphokinase